MTAHKGYRCSKGHVTSETYTKVTFAHRWEDPDDYEEACAHECGNEYVDWPCGDTDLEEGLICNYCGEFFYADDQHVCIDEVTALEARIAELEAQLEDSVPKEYICEYMCEVAR